VLTNADGEWDVDAFPNGVRVAQLRKPSPAYIAAQVAQQAAAAAAVKPALEDRIAALEAKAGIAR
jgi:hypothetical protein